ncbi:MAG: hypothetical protein [Microvirus sp.]|nr:MAG: hypothetical protein [Microvirus sp.]
MDSNPRTAIVPEKGDLLVCTVYDVLAKEHGPIFYAPNMGLLWRNVDGLIKQATNVNPSEFVVVIHGTFKVSDFNKPLFSYPYPVFFSTDRQPLSVDAVNFMVGKGEDL